MRALVAILVLVAVAVFATVVLTEGESAPAASRPPSDTVVPEGAYGLSVEYEVMTAWLAEGTCASSSVRATLHSIPGLTLRIGGSSMDRLDVLPDWFWTRLRCFSDAIGAHAVVVGLPLARRSPDLVSSIADEARTAFAGRRLLLTIGNEADIYGRMPMLRATYDWPRRFDMGVYSTRYASRLAAIGRDSPVEGPDYAGRLPYEHGAEAASVHTARLRSFLERHRPDVVSLHAYPFSKCAGQRPDPGELLDRTASWGMIRRLGYAQRLGREYQLPVVLTETNSVSCRGLPGVSDSPESGVWAANTLLSGLSRGLAGVRLHVSNGVYDPISLGGDGLVHAPSWAGMRWAAAWLPPGSGVRRVPRPARGVTHLRVDHPRYGTVDLYASASDAAVPVPRGRASSSLVVADGRLRLDGVVWDGILPVTARDRGTTRLVVPPRGLLAVVAE